MKTLKEKNLEILLTEKSFNNQVEINMGFGMSKEDAIEDAYQEWFELNNRDVISENEMNKLQLANKRACLGYIN